MSKLDESGVVIILEPRTRIPRFIQEAAVIEIGPERMGNRKVRSLKIWGAKASFFPGGQVDVKMKGSSTFIVAFPKGENQVLEIRDFDGRVLARNHYLCTSCFELGGSLMGVSYSEYDGRLAGFCECRSCRHQWIVPNI